MSDAGDALLPRTGTRFAQVGVDESARAEWARRREDTGIGPSGRYPRAIDPTGALSPSPVHDWLPILHSLGLAPDVIRTLAARAKVTGTAFQTELLASGVVREEDLFRALAAELNLPFASSVDHQRLTTDDRSLRLLRRRTGIGLAMTVGDKGGSFLLVAPERLNIPRMRSFVRRHPDIAERIRVVPPAALRQAVIARARPALRRRATDTLFDLLPHCSARFVLNAWQGAALGAGAVALPVALVVAPVATTLALHSAVSVFFMACIVLRLLAACSVNATTARPRLSAVQPRRMPTYTVLVALYKEAEIVPDLLVALGRIVWPRSKLEIKLVCEEDDGDTIAAIEAQKLRPWIELIKVPGGGPRTKPKALSYALPLTCGDFVVLYDAEDKPHPLQLVEAWQRFCEEEADLACLQAPLAIASRTENLLTAMFALEYSALFRGILPWLARNRLTLPLGGTSNHFRRSILERVGAWDPYNVTEDADLGLRLARFGYRIGTITYPTQEDAPENIRAWLPQRTRWFKGWAQTWFVHMRSPIAAARDLGFGSFLVAQILFAGMLISALTYPIVLTTGLVAAAWVLAGQAITPSLSALFFLDVANVIFGHGAFLLLAWLTLKRNERGGFWKLALLTPVYWAMMSVAAFRSAWQLYRCPHRWEKTPHKPHGLMARAGAQALRRA